MGQDRAVTVEESLDLRAGKRGFETPHAGACGMALPTLAPVSAHTALLKQLVVRMLDFPSPCTLFLGVLFIHPSPGSSWQLNFHFQMILYMPSLGGMGTEKLGLGVEQEDSEQFKSSMDFEHVVPGYLHKSNIPLHSHSFIF